MQLPGCLCVYVSQFLNGWTNLYEIWRMPSSGMWRRVDLVWTDVSEECIASIFKVEKSASEEPAWAGGSLQAADTCSCWDVYTAEDTILRVTVWPCVFPTTSPKMAQSSPQKVESIQPSSVFSYYQNLIFAFSCVPIIGLYRTEKSWQESKERNKYYWVKFLENREDRRITLRWISGR
jgi:hypothetical protein